jgi:hypothetical protein
MFSRLTVISLPCAYQPYPVEVTAFVFTSAFHEAVLVSIPRPTYKSITILTTLTISSLSSHVPYSLNHRPQFSAHVP